MVEQLVTGCERKRRRGMPITGPREQEVQQQLPVGNSSSGGWCCWLCWYHSSLIVHSCLVVMTSSLLSSSSRPAECSLVQKQLQRHQRHQSRRRRRRRLIFWPRSESVCMNLMLLLLCVLLLLLVIVIPRTAHADLPPSVTPSSTPAQQPEFIPSLQQQQQRTMRNLPITPSQHLQHKEPSRNQRKVVAAATDEKENKSEPSMPSNNVNNGKPAELLPPTATTATVLEEGGDEQQQQPPSIQHLDEPKLPSLLIPSKITNNSNNNGNTNKHESTSNNNKDADGRTPATPPDDSSRGNKERNKNSDHTLRSRNGSAGNNSTIRTTTTVSPQQKQHEREFLVWCRQVLGIYTILEIATFEYDNYMKGLPDEDWDNGNDIVVVSPPTTESTIPKIHVRGLAASRDIAIGETVIRIPWQALISVATTIDQDPVLSHVMGPAARKAHGWIIGSDDDAAAAFAAASASQQQDDVVADDINKSNNNYADDSIAMEMPLLAMALLHHKRLKSASPLAHYVTMLEASPIDSMPFLWSREKLRAEVSEGIRTVARGIQLEMEEMYATVAQVLIAEHPHIFGNNTNDRNDRSNDDDQQEETTEDEWFFSYEHFQWAFAMVNSRHWHLPIPDLFATTTADINKAAEATTTQQRATAETASSDKNKSSNGGGSNSFMESTEEQDAGGLPPANMPTDTWIQEHDGEIDEEEEERIKKAKENNKPSSSSSSNNKVVRHSFLAPVADLLNFGPPCTKVHYNTESQTFEIIASCELKKGQEVTFYYSDECDHVMVGVYGFMHPLVPACPSAEDYRQKSEDYKSRLEKYEERLLQAYDDLDHAEEELRHLYEILSDCDCCHHEKPKQRAMLSDDSTSSSHFRGASRFLVPETKAPPTDAPTSTHGVRTRRSWRDRMSRKSEF